MDWEQEVVELIESYFNEAGVVYRASKDLHGCLIDYLNLRMKRISPKPRAIYKSTKIKGLSLPIKFINALRGIEGEIILGKDLTFHQSKKTLDPNYNDLLLNDWVIHHIHLSNTKSDRNQKFYDRSKYLLFSIFTNNNAYLIDIREHGERNVFAKKELLEIVDQNWPWLLRNLVDTEIKPHNYSDQEIDILRRKGYCIGLTSVNGKAIFNPGLGITCSGHNIQVVGRANDICRYLWESTEAIQRNMEDIKVELSKKTGNKIEDLALCVHRLDNWPHFAIFESTTQYYLEKNYNDKASETTET